MDIPVDSILNRWKKYLTNISSNLMELSDQTEFQLIKLKVSAGKDGYIGITKARALECVENLGELWRYFALLSEVMDKALNIYDKHIFAYKAEEDVTELFEKVLIVTDTERVDISDRNLLGNQTKEKRETPQKLLNRMQESFEKLCRDVAEISRAEKEVQVRLGNIMVEIERLNTTVKRLGIMSVPAFDTDTLERVENDPLQGMIELDKLVYSVEKYRASIRIIEGDYNDTVSRLAKAREVLIELRDLAVKSRAVLNESGKIFGEKGKNKPVISEEVLNSLEDWLRILEGKSKKGDLKAVKVGLSKLERECSLKLEIEKLNYADNSKAYNEWLDLKGEFKALLAKVSALKARSLLYDKSLDEIIEDTRSVLYAEPVDLDSCRNMVGKLRSNL